jgi:very-short-patch-repair endonuclease
MAIIKPGDVYLAGKVTGDHGHGDQRALWRARFGVSIEAEMLDPTRGYPTWDLRHIHGPQFLFGDERYPVVGPHAIACDHGCGHYLYTNDHNIPQGHCAVTCMGEGPHGRRRLADVTMQNLQQADVVIAWIDGDDLHGTIFEIGYARRQVLTIVGVQNEALAEDYWFLLNHHRDDYGGTHFIGPLDEFAEYVRSMLERPMPRLDSPLEEALYDAMPPAMQDEVVTQHEVGRYRLDFAFVDEQLCIEVDGRTYHSDEEAFARDRARDRWLTGCGWRVARFASDEVFNDAAKCIAEIEELRALGRVTGHAMLAKARTTTT